MASAWPLPTLQLQLNKVPIQYPPVDGRERRKLRGGHVLVDLVHGLADKAELEHRAIILDEARVRGAARGRELGFAAGRRGDRVDDEIDERPGLGEEHPGVRRQVFDAPARTARGRRAASLDQRLELLRRVQVVVADVEARARL